MEQTRVHFRMNEINLKVGNPLIRNVAERQLFVILPRLRLPEHVG